MPEGAVCKNQIADLRFLDRKSIGGRSCSAFLSIALKRKVITLKKLLPGSINRCWIAFIVLVELVYITDFGIGDVREFVHGGIGIVIKNREEPRLIKI